MVYDNPSDDVLRLADAVTLIDPRVPGWEEQLTVSITQVFPPMERGYVLVEIPVDSRNQAQCDLWRTRIAHLWDEDHEELARLRKQVEQELEIELEKLRQLGDEYWSSSRPNDR